MLYPVIMFKTDSGYDGYFPDVKGCFFAGNSLEETIRDAQKSFSQHVEVLTDMGGRTRTPSEHANLHADEHLTKDGGFLTFEDIDPPVTKPRR